MPISHNEINKKKEGNKQEPAFRIEEPFWTFSDVIIADSIREEIDNAIASEKYKNLIYDTWGLIEVFKREKALTMNLYGASGSGKTMTAHAIANQLEMKIVMVNYAEIESKYVGETSKNLVKLFDFARENRCVLVFDEADALLSRRVTSMNNATDVSVNQTRNVLLKLLDTASMPILFTTNFIQNYDGAFFRRISYHIKFDYPNKATRKAIWEHYLVEKFPLNGSRVEIIEEISEIEGISGAEISNVVYEAAVEAARKKIRIDAEGLKNKINKKKALKFFQDEVEIKRERISKAEAEKILERMNGK